MNAITPHNTPTCACPLNRKVPLLHSADWSRAMVPVMYTTVTKIQLNERILSPAYYRIGSLSIPTQPQSYYTESTWKAWTICVSLAVLATNFGGPSINLRVLFFLKNPAKQALGCYSRGSCVKLLRRRVSLCCALLPGFALVPTLNTTADGSCRNNPRHACATPRLLYEFWQAYIYIT